MGQLNKREENPKDCTLATRTTSLHSSSHSNTPGVTGCWGLLEGLALQSSRRGGGEGGGGEEDPSTLAVSMEVFITANITK